MKGRFTKAFLLLFLSLYATTFSQEPAPARCDGQSIKYSYVANMKDYLKYENNLDGREIYNELSDLHNKPVGIYSPTYKDSRKLGDYKNLQQYNSKDELVSDLINHKIEGGILFSGLAEPIKMMSNMLTIIERDLYTVDFGFGLKKNSGELKTQINSFIQGITDQKMLKLVNKWHLVNFENGYIDTDLDGANTLNVVAKIDSSPFCYKRTSDNSLIGVEVELLYDFAKQNGYKLVFTEVTTYEEQINALKNGNADIAIGIFVKTDNSADYEISDKLSTESVNMIIRNSNSPDNNSKQTKIYNSIEEFDGSTIGIMEGSYFDELTKQKFPKSKYRNQASPPILLTDLLSDESDGFFYDKPIGDYFKIKHRGRVTFYESSDLPKYQNAFAFRNDATKTKLLSEFNEFLGTLNLKDLYNSWMNNIDKLTVDVTSDQSWPTINAEFVLDNYPICYMEKNKPKGLEMDILYRFAKEKHYNINLISITSEQRTNSNADIVGGVYSITEDRKKIMQFSDPLYDSPAVLIVRVENKADEFPIIIRGNDWKQKNTADIDVKFGDVTKQSKCTFPEYYSNSLLINCEIPNIQNIDFDDEFEYVGTEDKITLVFGDYEANNFFQANKKIPNHNDIIKQSDFDDLAYTCSSSGGGGRTSSGSMTQISIKVLAAIIAISLIIF